MADTDLNKTDIIVGAVRTALGIAALVCVPYFTTVFVSDGGIALFLKREPTFSNFYVKFERQRVGNIFQLAQARALQRSFQRTYSMVILGVGDNGVRFMEPFE